MTPAEQNPARIQALDGLRGCAIALVLWAHLVHGYLETSSSRWAHYLAAATDLSWAGVDLFFVLSGFFIGGILLDHRDSPRLARVFYLRRAVRILPLYYVTLAVIAVIIAARVPFAYHDSPAWVYPLFLTNIAIAMAGIWDWTSLSLLWSLAVEEQFYLAAPWIAKALPRRWQPWFALLLVGLAILFRAGIRWLAPENELANHVLMPARMDCLALGALVAWAVRTEAAQPFFQALRRWWVGVLLASGGFIVLLTALRVKQGDAWLSYFGYTLLAAIFAALVAIVIGVRPPLLTRVLSLRPLVHLGRHSYFIYLWHVLIGQSIIDAVSVGPLAFNVWTCGLAIILGIAATWLAAIVSWKFFEGPCVAWGHRHRY